MADLVPLPVDALLPEIVAHLRTSPSLVLRSPTGSGKTTRVPAALEEAGLGPVVLLEPRRLAARAAARRMADERGERLGGRFGYVVRFDRKVGPSTRVTAVTEGVFLRRVLADPLLEGISCVVFDEFHERHLEGDLSLALARRVQREVRPDLRIVVLSATLDPGPVASFLDAAVVESEGRLHPVEVLHQPPRGREPLEEQVARGVRELARRTAGDLLVFLPGMREIRRAERELERDGLELRVLHGDLGPAEQDAALARGPHRRVVLATNLAESSVTVEGVTGVVDSGLARVPRFDARLGLDRLELVRISMESVEQRAGRAGRLEPGVDLRLWSALDERAFPAGVEPEIARVDLAGAWLALHEFGESDPAAFGWFEAPPVESGERAAELLRALGATCSTGRGESSSLTPLGRELARLPVHPRLGRLLFAGRELGCLRRAALAAALFAERDPLRRVLAELDERRVHDSDVLERVEILERVESGRGGSVPRGAVRRLLAARDQLLRAAGGASAEDESEEAGDPDEALLRALFTAFADRLARRRTRRPARDGSKRRPTHAGGAPRAYATRDDPEGARLVSGRGVRLARESRVRDAELFVCVDLDAGEGEGLVRQASRVEREWLDPVDLEQGIVATFDAERDAAVIRRVTSWRGLVLSEAETGDRGPEAMRALEEALLAAALRTPERAFDLASGELSELTARLACLSEWMPELDLDAPDPTAWVLEHAGELVVGRRSFAELSALDLAAELRGRLDHVTRKLLDEAAPTRMPLPRGRSGRLAYERGRPPVLAARIQDFFGLDATPTVCRGRVPVLLHLCAPNGRPQQVTSDLPGFWRGTYAQVRKDLRGRYPKHDWPEDPVGFEPKRGRRRG